MRWWETTIMAADRDVDAGGWSLTIESLGGIDFGSENGSG